MLKSKTTLINHQQINAETIKSNEPSTQNEQAKIRK